MGWFPVQSDDTWAVIYGLIAVIAFALATIILLWIIKGIFWRPKISPDDKNKVIVYHGTRIPMSTIIKNGIPALSTESRKALYEAVKSMLEQIGIKDIHFDGHDLKKGVYVTHSYKSAEKFALAAPAFISDAIVDTLTLEGYPKQELDYALLSILDLIGQPKVIECHVARNRFVKGQGAFGSVLDCILPEDIAQIHTLSYNEPYSETKQAVDNIKSTAIVRWNRKETPRVQGNQSGEALS